MLFGIDYASVDENKINLAVAKAQGLLSFAIPRATYGTYVDPIYKDQVAGLKSIGIVTGAYAFLRCPFKGARPVSPEDQIDAFVAAVGPLGCDSLPPSLDVEFPGNGFVDTGWENKAMALDWVRRAWSRLQTAYKIDPIVYTSARVWQEDLGNQAAPEMSGSPLWLAKYLCNAKKPAMRDASIFQKGTIGIFKKPVNPPIPLPWQSASKWADNFWIHQYQGDAIGFPGFSNTVDMNRFNPLLLGSSGSRVEWLQRKLKITVNGYFDQVTAQALAAFQKSLSLDADAIVGPKTFCALAWLA